MESHPWIPIRSPNCVLCCNPLVSPVVMRGCGHTCCIVCMYTLCNTTPTCHGFVDTEAVPVCPYCRAPVQEATTAKFSVAQHVRDYIQRTWPNPNLDELDAFGRLVNMYPEGTHIPSAEQCYLQHVPTPHDCILAAILRAFALLPELVHSRCPEAIVPDVSGPSRDHFSIRTRDVLVSGKFTRGAASKIALAPVVQTSSSDRAFSMLLMAVVDSNLLSFSASHRREFTDAFLSLFNMVATPLCGRFGFLVWYEPDGARAHLKLTLAATLTLCAYNTPESIVNGIMTFVTMVKYVQHLVVFCKTLVEIANDALNYAHGFDIASIFMRDVSSAHMSNHEDCRAHRRSFFIYCVALLFYHLCIESIPQAAAPIDASMCDHTPTSASTDAHTDESADKSSLSLSPQTAGSSASSPTSTPPNGSAAAAHMLYLAETVQDPTAYAYTQFAATCRSYDPHMGFRLVRHMVIDTPGIAYRMQFATHNVIQRMCAFMAEVACYTEDDEISIMPQGISSKRAAIRADFAHMLTRIGSAPHNHRGRLTDIHNWLQPPATQAPGEKIVADTLTKTLVFHHIVNTRVYSPATRSIYDMLCRRHLAGNDPASMCFATNALVLTATGVQRHRWRWLHACSFTSKTIESQIYKAIT